MNDAQEILITESAPVREKIQEERNISDLKSPQTTVDISLREGKDNE